MEKSLLQHTVNFKEIIEALPMLFLIVKPDAPDFTILDANRMFLKAGNLLRQEILNRPVFEIIHATDDGRIAVEHLKQSLEKVILTKKSDKLPVQMFNIQNAESGVFEERYWLPKNTPVLNEAGNIEYIVHYVEDVTETVLSEKRSKAEARAAAKEIDKKSKLIEENSARIDNILNVLVKYTAMEFTEKVPLSRHKDRLDAVADGLNKLGTELRTHIEKLSRSNHELETVNKELDAFSYSVSHDLRAPLRAVDGYSRMILEDYGEKLDNEGKRCVYTIINNAIRMGALIDDLLAFSRLGKQQPTKVFINMSSVTDSVVNELQGRYSTGRKIHITVHPLKPAEADSSMIRQVMSNLVSNAIKYSQKKEKPVIEIGCTEDPEKQRVVYYVRDNGAGFDMKYYSKLFGVFQRLHNKHEFEGTGVGLALVDRIVKKHGGEVWGEGKNDEGAVFYFSLPDTVTT